MRIIRPQQLVVIKGGYQLGRESRLGVSVIAGCYLSQPAHFVSEAQIWEAWRSAPVSFSALDAAEPKPFAEYLIAGHAGIGRPVKTLNVSADIGSLSRRWRIEGEGRRGTLGVEPFLRMPMDHPSAWGGTEVKENPLGRGSDDGLRPLLMNLVADGSAQERSPLAAPTPVPHEFLLRKAHIDKVASQMSGKEYLETVFPGLPAAIDRRYFQMAPPAQWLSEAEWPDQVPFGLQGFHAQGEAIHGVLPAVRGQVFIRRHGSGQLETVALQRKTLWFLPDSDIALMIFTGSVPVGHLLDESIELMMVALDRCDAPRSFDHFQQVLHKRSDDGASPFEFLFDPDLMPADMGLNIIESAADHPSSLRYDPTPTAAGTSAAFYQRIREAIAAHQQQQAEPAESEALQEVPDNNEADLLYQDIATLEEKNFSGVRFSGHLAGKTFLRCRFVACDFSQATLENCAFEKCVFVAADLTRTTLRNVRMSHCSLQDAVLTESHLREVTFDNVTLEAPQGQRLQVGKSTLNYCVFNQGTLSASCFDACTIGNGMFNGTVLSGVRFLQGQLDACIFNRCLAEEAESIDMVMTKNSLLGGVWRKTRFERSSIESMTAGMQVDFACATFSDCSFTKVGLKQADLAGCRLLHCSFIESNFDQADLTSSSIAACDMAGARFKDSVLAHSRWQNTSLQQGMLYNADLRDAGFDQCNLASANLAMSWQDAATQFSGCLFERACWVPRRALHGGYPHDN